MCGIRSVEAAEVAAELGEPVGSVLYLVEFDDGDSLELPERLLERVDGPIGVVE